MAKTSKIYILKSKLKFYRPASNKYLLPAFLNEEKLLILVRSVGSMLQAFTSMYNGLVSK